MRETGLYRITAGPCLVGGRRWPVPHAGPFVERMRPVAELGIDMVILMPTGPDPVGFGDGAGAEIVPHLAEL